MGRRSLRLHFGPQWTVPAEAPFSFSETHVKALSVRPSQLPQVSGDSRKGGGVGAKRKGLLRQKQQTFCLFGGQRGIRRETPGTKVQKGEITTQAVVFIDDELICQ